MSAGFTDAGGRKFMAPAVASVRFGSIKIFDCESESDGNAKKQFAAIFIFLPDRPSTDFAEGSPASSLTVSSPL